MPCTQGSQQNTMSDGKYNLYHSPSSKKNLSHRMFAICLDFKDEQTWTNNLNTGEIYTMEWIKNNS